MAEASIHQRDHLFHLISSHAPQSFPHTERLSTRFTYFSRRRQQTMKMQTVFLRMLASSMIGVWVNGQRGMYINLLDAAR
jgi:hypothetical protein